MSAEVGQSSRWGRGPVLPVGVRLTRRVREEPPPGELARVYSDRNATMSAAQRRGSAGMDRRPSPHRENWATRVSLQAVWPGWIAGRAPTGRTGPRGFHYRLFGRDGSPAEPPPGELGRAGFITGCLAGMDRRPSPHRENWAAWVFITGCLAGMDRRTNAARLCLRAAQLVRLTTAASRPWTGVAGPSSPVGVRAGPPCAEAAWYSRESLASSVAS